MKIVVIGAGGIGSHLVPLLLNMMSEQDELAVMDGDKLETRNLDRQRFRPDQVGMNKAEAISQLYDRDNLNFIPLFLTSPAQLRKFDVIICCPDNDKARLVALDAGKAHGSLVITAGNETDTANACVFSNEIAEHLPNVDPVVRYPDMLKPDEEERVSCHERKESAPQTEFANAVASQLALALFKYWTTVAVNLPLEIKLTYAPVEFIYAPSAYKTVKTGDLHE